MDVGPAEITQGAVAIKAVMEAFKTALGLVRAAKDALPKGTETEALEKD